MKRKGIIKYLLLFTLLTTFFFTMILFTSYLLGPPPLTNEQNTVFYNQAGEVIGEERGLESRKQLTLEEMSPYIIDATLVVEDRSFFDHHGFDYKRIFAAILNNLKSGSLKEGASTLTQQLARNLYLSHEKTWSRKLKEAFYTIRLEMFYTKEEILESYLNTIYFGHGTYGIEKASNYFFQKSAEELNVAEAAMLAGIPKGPSYYSPFNDEENANKRQAQILHMMYEREHISKEQFDEAINKELVYATPTEESIDVSNQYFLDEVLKEAANQLDVDVETIRSGGYHIYTTLNSNMQNNLEQSIKASIPTSSEIEIGAMAMDPKTGAIRALMGGRDYKKSPFNRATQAKRMPGSTFKPFLYYAALENGYKPTTKLSSKPTAFRLEDGNVYQPSNFNDYYAYKPITLAQALALSDNVYAVKTNLFLGEETVVETARRFGITSDLPAVPSIALGTASISVKEMVRGYAMLTNGGYEVDGHTISKIKDAKGKVLYEREKGKGDLVLDPVQAFILTDLMTGMFDSALNGYTAVTGSAIANQLSRTYAGKSGTTDSDSWMIGFSPSLVAGIWTGYDDNRPIHLVSENAYARNIWASFMEGAHEGKALETFPAPRNLVAVPIDPESGQRATTYCENSRVMYFEKGTEPKHYCTEHLHSDPPTKDRNKEDKGLVERWFDQLFGG